MNLLSISKRSFTISNTGTAVLSILQMAVGDSDASDFVLGSTGVAILNPGESKTLEMTF